MDWWELVALSGVFLQVSGLAQVPGVTAFDKFSAVLSAEDVLHSDIQVILGNVEKLPDVL